MKKSIGIAEHRLCGLVLALCAGSFVVASWHPGLAAEQPAPASPPAPVSSEPQETSATFGDWVMHCSRAGDPPGKRICEAAQSLIVKGQQAPIAQIAIGPNTSGKDRALTVVVPVNVGFDKPPRVGGTDDAHMTTLAFRRCVPGGCLADAMIDAKTLKDLTTQTKPGRLIFTDASERTVALPLSYRGLLQAIDALAKESGDR